jgi:hypothetical protein
VLCDNPFQIHSADSLEQSATLTFDVVDVQQPDFSPGGAICPQQMKCFIQICSLRCWNSMGNPGVWIGLAVAAAFLAGAVYLRRNRDVSHRTSLIPVGAANCFREHAGEIRRGTNLERTGFHSLLRFPNPELPTHFPFGADTMPFSNRRQCHVPKLQHPYARRKSRELCGPGPKARF